MSAGTITARSIGSMTATVTIEESGTDSLEITQHPVQSGAAITDHAYSMPAELALKVAFAPEGTPLDIVYANLRSLQASREPMDIVTGKRKYQNMLIKSLGVTTDATTENVLSVSLSCQEVILATVETVKVPPRKVQKIPQKTGQTANTGEKSAQKVDAPKKSALKMLAGGFSG